MLMTENKVLPGRYYRHFKGNLYKVICIALHTETNEKMVIYQAQYGSFGLYARPLSMFIEKVDLANYPDAKQEYRFELVETDNDPKT